MVYRPRSPIFFENTFHHDSPCIGHQHGVYQPNKYAPRRALHNGIHLGEVSPPSSSCRPSPNRESPTPTFEASAPNQEDRVVWDRCLDQVGRHFDGTRGHASSVFHALNLIPPEDLTRHVRREQPPNRRAMPYIYRSSPRKSRATTATHERPLAQLRLGCIFQHVFQRAKNAAYADVFSANCGSMGHVGRPYFPIWICVFLGRCNGPSFP